MNIAEIAAESGPLAVLIGLVAKLMHGMLGGIMRELQALRAELKAHIAQDDERHAGVVATLQQRWAAQPRN